MLIDPLDLLRKLKDKDPDKFKVVTLAVSEYCAEVKAPEDVFKAIVDLIDEQQKQERHLHLVQ